MGPATGTAPRRRRPTLRSRELLNPAAPGDHNQAMMELGATVCLRHRPSCPACPVRGFCAAAKAGDPGAYPRLSRSRPCAARSYGCGASAVARSSSTAIPPEPASWRASTSFRRRSRRASIRPASPRGRSSPEGAARSRGLGSPNQSIRPGRRRARSAGASSGYALRISIRSPSQDPTASGRRRSYRAKSAGGASPETGAEVPAGRAGPFAKECEYLMSGASKNA